ncbi:MAG: WYL domain-containing protein, partial [Thermoleophilia bacterium]|nr:WYL domain-containing protein [Thermoleophilia bacterium]
WTPARDEERERAVNPYGLFFDNGAWYFVGQDLDDERRKMFRVSRVRGEIRFSTRRERDFRIPADFDVDEYRGRPSWQVGEPAGEARIRVAPATAWWVERLYGDRGRLEGDVFVTEYASLPMLASWILRQDGRAVPLEPPALRREVAAALRTIRDAHKGAPPAPARESAADTSGEGGERPAGPVAPERFAVLQALLAHLLAACGDDREALIPAAELSERFGIPPDQLEEHLSLLNLVNFGGGCYTVYAELRGDEVHVDKELYGDTFRAAPRLTPLEARAIRLALEFVGPMIAADAHTPLDRVRKKLEETFGQFEVGLAPAAQAETEAEDLVGVLARASRERRLVEIVYLKEEDAEPTTHVIEAYSLERKLPWWYVHSWDRTRDGERSFRLDRMQSAKIQRERFEARPGFEPRGLQDARTALLWFSPAVARWRLERGGARRLADGAALAETRVGSDEWLVGEVFSHRGEAVVLEPDDLRRRVSGRAAELLRELREAATASPAARA